MARERTFLMVKPDGVQRHLVGDIIKRFETKGFQLVAMKFMHASQELLEQHYAEHVGKPFFSGLVNYISSGPVVAMVWEGQDIVGMARTMMGATKPAAAAPGTIRGDYCMVMSRNVIHGSDSVESAQREISLWFPEGVVEWHTCDDDWLNMGN